MEACSCNIPVLSTEFGALTRLFKDVSGFRFATSRSEFIENLTAYRDSAAQVKTRDAVMSYDWNRLASEIENIYSRLTCRSRVSEEGRPEVG